MFPIDYKQQKVYDWKKDVHLEKILKITLDDNELDYIKNIKAEALNALLDLLEYKILQDFRDNLNIKESNADAIGYIRDIEKILKPEQ